MKRCTNNDCPHWEKGYGSGFQITHCKAILPQALKMCSKYKPEPDKVDIVNVFDAYLRGEEALNGLLREMALQIKQLQERSDGKVDK